MVDALVFLASLTLVLLAGIASVYIAKRLRLPLPLVLFASGVILGNVVYNGKPIIELGEQFLSAFSIIALIIVLFDSTSKIKFYDIDKSMKDSFLFFIITLMFNLFIISNLSISFFNIDIFSSIILSLLVSCVEFTAILSKSGNKVMEFLKDESNISCAFILFVPFMIISFVNTTLFPINGIISFLPFIVGVFGGIGIGLMISLILFNVTKKLYMEKFSSFILAFGLLLAYLAAQKIDGNGIVAVATVGFIFGNIFLKQKGMIKKQENMIYSALEVFMFILVGVVMGFMVSFEFAKLSFILFFVYLLVRLVIAMVVLRNYDFAEKLEIATFVPKGLATITVAFALLNYAYSGFVVVTELVILFFVYSLIVDTVLNKAGVYKSR